MEENTIAKIFNESVNGERFAENYSNYIQNLLSRLDKGAIQKVVQYLIEVRDRDSTVFIVGNGGSASTASHFSQDLVACVKTDTQKQFKVISLTDNVSFITAAGNDLGFESIFTAQLKGLFKKGDTLIAISASGNSPNIIESVKFIKERGGICIGLTGFDGGKLRKLSDYSIHVDTPPHEYGPVEAVHSVVFHLIANYIFCLINKTNP